MINETVSVKGNSSVEGSVEDSVEGSILLYLSLYNFDVSIAIILPISVVLINLISCFFNSLISSGIGTLYVFLPLSSLL